jgi:hypothetical protein
MPQTEFGPTNIDQGNLAEFVAEFFDSNHNVTVPIGATLNVSYTNINNASQTDSVTMAQINSFYVATWSSTSASFGLANWSITAAGNSSASQVGQIRVIDP